MAIRKKIEWDGKQFCGYVDLGRDYTDVNDNAQEATNAIVFMLVCINGYFKIPIAYYFIHSLSGKEKSTFILNILDECHLNDIDVRHLTFDGASSNITMAESLGAKIYNTTEASFFIHKPIGKKIYVSLDACHMVKLIRNAFSVVNFVNSEDKIISWKYIESLVDLQEEIGLHFATKIRRRHITFQNEKMKVHLAVQVLSGSVAKALRNIEYEHKLEKFEGASATAEFCEIINEAFDILNSKNLYNKNRDKKAISIENLKDIKVRVEKCILYIKGLKIGIINVLQTNKRTGFLGLVIDLQNIVQLAESLFNSRIMSFFLTFKLSQDHLETFFSCIRRFGGFNNNPTVRQYQSAHKKLLSHISISVPLSANCIPQDDTLLLKIDNETESAAKNSLIEIDLTELEEINWLVPNKNLGSLVDDIIAYISGAVVRIVRKKISCKKCLETLYLKNDEKSISTLQRLKCRGSLINASIDVITVCTMGEKLLRFESNFLQKNLIEKLIIKTMYIIPQKIFDTNSHIFDQSPLSDHRYQLIKLILNHYFQIRLHHEAKKIQGQNPRIRMRNNKLTLFYNQ